MNPSWILTALALSSPAAAQWTTGSLSLERARLTAVSVDGKALFAGGFVAPLTYASRVDIWDAATDTWTVAHLSGPRSELASASAGGRAFFGGGRADVVFSDRVDIYDAATASWTTDSLSQPRRGLAAASAGGLVFFAGGWVAPIPSVITDVVDIHDTATGTWSTAHLSTARTELAATAVGSQVLFGGGRDFGTTCSNRVDIYDVNTASWSTAQLAVGRRQLAATSVGDLALFAGGTSGPTSSSVRTEVDIYDASTGTWSLAFLSIPRQNLTAVSVGHLALFAGGLAAGAVDRVDIFDSITGLWSTSTLSSRRSSLASAAVAGTALFAGGFKPAGATSPDIDLFNPWLGTDYCSPAVPSSTGLPGRILAAGSPIVAQANVTLLALDLPPGQFGYFLAGLAQGFIQPPGSQGPICLSGDIGRYNRAGEILQGPLGALQLDLASMPTNPPTAVMPGDTWNFQCWYRDANPTTTSNTTNALAVTFATTGDPTVQFAVTQASIVEDATQVEVRVTLSQPANHDVLVPYTTGGTATVNVDWRVEEPNPFVIPAGQTHADMTLTIAEDGAQEPDESAIVSLATPTGAVPGTATMFTLTIVDDD